MATQDEVKTKVMDNRVSTGLAKRGDLGELGKAIIEEAKEENKKALKKSVIGVAQELMASIGKMEDVIENCEQNINLQRRKLRAIEDGEFVLGNYGSITYKETELQKALTGLKGCPNCGMNVDPTRR